MEMWPVFTATHFESKGLWKAVLLTVKWHYIEAIAKGYNSNSQLYET